MCTPGEAGQLAQEIGSTETFTLTVANSVSTRRMLLPVATLPKAEPAASQTSRPARVSNLPRADGNVQQKNLNRQAAPSLLRFELYGASSRPAGGTLLCRLRLHFRRSPVWQGDGACASERSCSSGSSSSWDTNLTS